MNKVTVLMYHYVRNLRNSRYSDIKGLDSSLFEEQIKFLKSHYNFVSIEDVISAVDANTNLPEKSVLLTFDDCYKDHYTNVFPILVKYGIKGAFYAPMKCLKEKKVLDVNKIHFILASEKNKSVIINEIKVLLVKYKDEYNLSGFDSYYAKLAIKSRFDTAEVIFIKRLLQVELDEELRNIIVDNLFERFIGISEEAFCEELYLTEDQIFHMYSCGMHFGSHSYDHYWLNSLSKEEQRKQIDLSLESLKDIGIDTSNWTMCYPYGGYNEATVEVLREMKCKLALTTKVDVYNINHDNRYEIPRLDTNDIPKSSSSEVNSWYEKG